jgi:hypothetical protein
MSGLGEMAAVALGPREVASGRPFTALHFVEADVAVLHELLADVRTLLDEAAAGARAIIPYRKVGWRAPDGLVHRHVICAEERLRSHPGLCVVGFFGERRTDLDIAPLEEANAAVVREFAKYPGITSYSSMELPGGHWANMVLHDDPVDTDYWRQSTLHADAVRRLARVHYRTVRIHNARLTTPVRDDPALTILRTKYFDYTSEPEWRAVRKLG